MATQWYLESTKAVGLRFKILKLDKQTMRAELLGDTGVPFERVINEDVLQKYGYKVVKVDEPEAVVEA
ncbi:hypothetical protein [Burkholderia anthina]|uniref:hypothetical protein n=1 Tax=Burkholderia anthina TaxID=179879 RepID=UPI0037C013F3